MRNHRCRAAIFGLTVLLLGGWLAPLPVSGQAPTVATKPTVVAKTYAPKTPWGDPDLQGMWTMWDETPFQAPDPARPGAADREDNSSEVFVLNGKEFKYEGLGSGMSREHTSPVSPRRRSLVVDPPSGRIPVIPSKVRRVNQRALFDTWEAHNAWSRCISHGVPGRLLNAGLMGYNKAYQLLQSPGYVVIFLEQLHDARIIPLGGRPHVGPDIRLWQGDSRGRWEGQTLVVETTNFNNKGDGLGGTPQTEALRVVERFTRTDPKTLNYEVTIEDPNVYSQPWTARQPHNLDPAYVIYEYACHEGNTRYMEGTLTRGRLLDAEEAEKKKTNQR